MESQISTFSHNFSIIQKESILYFYQFLGLESPRSTPENKTFNVVLCDFFFFNSNVCQEELIKGKE